MRAGGLRGAADTLLEGAQGVEAQLLEQLQGATHTLGGIDPLKAMGTWNLSTKRSQLMTVAMKLEQSATDQVRRILDSWT